MFWDGTRWIDERAGGRLPAPSTPERGPLRSWLAALVIMILATSLTVPAVLAGPGATSRSVGGNALPGDRLRMNGLSAVNARRAASLAGAALTGALAPMASTAATIATASPTPPAKPVPAPRLAAVNPSRTPTAVVTPAPTLPLSGSTLAPTPAPTPPPSPTPSPSLTTAGPTSAAISSPAAPSYSHLGLCINGIAANTPSTVINQTLDAAVRLGSGGIRVDVPWQAVEWGRNQWAFGSYDTLIRGAAQRELRVDVILDFNNPLYGGQWNQMPLDLAAWSRYVSVVVSRYRGQATSFEVWNEPDIPMFNADAADPSRYLELLRVTYAIVKQNDPDALVVTAAMASQAVTPLYWETIAAQAQAFFDIANLHVYSGDVAARVGATARLNPGKPIWVTELGHDAADPTLQAEYLTQAVRSLQSQHVATIWVFQLRDHVTAVTPRRYGLLDENWLPRPAAEAFHSLASGWRN